MQTTIAERPSRIDGTINRVRTWHREQIAIRKVMYQFPRDVRFSNEELAALFGVSRGEASKMVSRHEAILIRERVGRSVQIGLR